MFPERINARSDSEVIISSGCSMRPALVMSDNTFELKLAAFVRLHDNPRRALSSASLVGKGVFLS